MSDGGCLDQMINCSCGRRHRKSDRCDGAASGVVLDFAAAPCDTMQFVADLEPTDERRCVVDVRYDALAKTMITVVHYIDGVTTSSDFERAFNAKRDEHQLRACTTEPYVKKPWPSGIVDRVHDPDRQIHSGFESAIRSDRFGLAHALYDDAVSLCVRELAQLAYDPEFWAARQLARRTARLRRQRRKQRRGWA